MEEKIDDLQDLLRGKQSGETHGTIN
jgi:hypothetical protein